MIHSNVFRVYFQIILPVVFGNVFSGLTEPPVFSFENDHQDSKVVINIDVWRQLDKKIKDKMKAACNILH